MFSIINQPLWGSPIYGGPHNIHIIEQHHTTKKTLLTFFQARKYRKLICLVVWNIFIIFRFLHNICIYIYIYIYIHIYMESHHPNYYSLHHFSEGFINHQPDHDDQRGQSQRWPSRLPGSPWLTGHQCASQQGPSEPCGGPLDSVCSDVLLFF